MLLTRTWPWRRQESNKWRSDSWHQINGINPKTGVATSSKEKSPWHQNPPHNHPVLRSWQLSWFRAAKDTSNNAAGTGKRLMLPQRKDIFQTLGSCATILISLMMEQPKTSWISIPKRAYVFRTKGFKRDGEQDQKSCTISKFVKVGAGDHYKSGKLSKYQLWQRQITLTVLFCHERLSGIKCLVLLTQAVECDLSNSCFECDSFSGGKKPRNPEETGIVEQAC